MVFASTAGTTTRPRYIVAWLLTTVWSLDSIHSRVASGQAQDGLDSAFRMLESDTPVSPNGNSVSLEAEAYKSAEAMGNHTMALTVYGKTLDFLRSAIGKV